MNLPPGIILSDNFFIEFVGSAFESNDKSFLPYLWNGPRSLDECLEFMKNSSYGDILFGIRMEFYLESSPTDLPIGVDSLKGLPVRYISFRKNVGIATVAFWVPMKRQTDRVPLFLASCYWKGTHLVLGKLKGKVDSEDRTRILADLENGLMQYLQVHGCVSEKSNLSSILSDEEKCVPSSSPPLPKGP